MSMKYDRWIVRDDAGLLHNALVGRFYQADDTLAVLQVSTACRPKVKQMRFDGSPRWNDADLPMFALEGFMIMAWRIHEPVSCFECLAAGEIP